MPEQLEELIQSFHLMWDYFPEPCSIIHKSKKVIAVNPACAKIGREVGMICSQHGPAENHKGCLALKASQEQQAQCKRGTRGDNEVQMFWLPTDGYLEYYLHLGLVW